MTEQLKSMDLLNTTDWDNMSDIPKSVQKQTNNVFQLKWNSLSVLNTNIIDTTGILNILSGQAFRILQLMLQTSLELFVNQLQAR